MAPLRACPRPAWHQLGARRTGVGRRRLPNNEEASFATRRSALLRSAFLCLLLLFCAITVQACELRVRRHPDPLVLVRLPDGELSGPQLETVREALRRIGCRMKVVPLPWARALSDLASGELDVLPGAHALPEREAYALFSSSPWISHNRLYMRSADLQRLGDPVDLERFLLKGRLGLQVGVVYGATVERLLQDERVKQQTVRAASRQGLWQMLAKGRVDGVLADEFGGAVELRRLGLDAELRASTLSLATEPSHTAFSRRTVSAELVARFDAAMQAMLRDGTQAGIYKRINALIATTP